MTHRQSVSLAVLSLVSLTLRIPALVEATSYPVVRTYSGSTFFDRWDYFGAYDNTTLGDVTWVNETVATDTTTGALTYANDAGNTILKVDNTTDVTYNYKRNSVRVTSQDTYDVGSVWVMDALHVPYGCSVWPAFWSDGADVTWPAGGEIDVFEGVNLQTNNQMTLHTSSGCNLTTSSTTYTGIVNSTDCNTADDDNAGCAITDDNSNSYGSAFAAAGGGVWITELAETGVSIWFFTRADVPSAVTSSATTIDTSTLGTPQGFWSNTGCDIDSHFSAQQLILDITLCGSWAGEATILEETCPALVGTATCYTTYVLDPSNYDEAYFEISYISVFSSSNSNSTSSSTSTSDARNMASSVWAPLAAWAAGTALVLSWW